MLVAQLNHQNVGRTGTMVHKPPESDWKVFRELQEVARERFCERILQEGKHAGERAANSYEAVVELQSILRDRHRELRQLFDDLRRSQMMLQLTAYHARDLLEPDEFGRFSSGTRETVEKTRRALE